MVPSPVAGATTKLEDEEPREEPEVKHRDAAEDAHNSALRAHDTLEPPGPARAEYDAESNIGLKGDRRGAKHEKAATKLVVEAAPGPSMAESREVVPMVNDPVVATPAVKGRRAVRTAYAYSQFVAKGTLPGPTSATDERSQG